MSILLNETNHTESHQHNKTKQQNIKGGKRPKQQTTVLYKYEQQ